MIQKNSTLLHELKCSVIYEVNIRQYTPEGTFKAFGSHLPRLRKMGVDIIWLMPIHPIGKMNRKGTLGSYYSISNHEAINPEFGTSEDFKELVGLTHQLGMKIIIDWVANHVAWDHVWTDKHSDYFLKEATGQFHSPYDWTDVIQIDHHHTQAHDAMRAAMCYWLNEFDIDGFRADLAHLTPLQFWKQARMECEKIKPNLIWLAETEDADYYEAFDIVYAWKWMHGTERFCKSDESVSTLFDLLIEQNKAYPHDALQLYFTSNHDENSWNGTEFEKYGPYATLLSVFSYIYPSAVPLIYSGQEMPNHKRLAFFEKDALQWHNPLQHELLYHKLYMLRKQDWTGAALEPLLLSNRVVGFGLFKDSRKLFVFLNFSEQPFHINLHHEKANGTFHDMEVGELVQLSGDFDVMLSAAGYIILYT